MIKVLLTGSTYTGKSTLIQTLEDHNFGGVYYLKELARQFLDDNPGIERDPLLQDYLFENQIQAEKKAENAGAKVLICDRGVPDNIAHAYLFGQSIKPEWQAWSQTYDVVFLTNPHDVPFLEPTELQLKIDPDRNWQTFRDDLHTLIVHTLTECGLYPILLEGPPSQRLESITSWLRPWFLNGPEGAPRRRQERR